MNSEKHHVTTRTKPQRPEIGNRFCLLEVEEGVSDAEDEEIEIEDIHHMPTKNKKVKRRKNVEVDRTDTDTDNDDTASVKTKKPKRKKGAKLYGGGVTETVKENTNDTNDTDTNDTNDTDTNDTNDTDTNDTNDTDSGERDPAVDAKVADLSKRITNCQQR